MGIWDLGPPDLQFKTTKDHLQAQKQENISYSVPVTYCNRVNWTVGP
jgi:hypothetical protein